MGETSLEHGMEAGKQVCERGRDGGEEVSNGSKGEEKEKKKNGRMGRAEKEGCRCGNKNGWIRQEVLRNTHTHTHSAMEILGGTDLFFK